MSNLFYHKEITDSQWNRIKFLFPQKKVGRPPLALRIVFNAVFWILTSGARWRDLNWNSVYHKFRKWCESGLFELLLHLVNADAKEAALLEIDSTFCKVHQSACSALKDQAIGASRGGKNTKVQTGGNIHDSETAIELFANVDIEGKKVLADKAYSCQAILDYLEKRGAVVCIPDKLTFKTKHTFDADLYKQRNKVERFFR